MTFIADFVSKYRPRIFCIYAVDLIRIEKYGCLCSLQVVYILLKFPPTFLIACWHNHFKVKSFQLVDCCCVVLNKLNSHCWSCSVKMQAWKILCVCVIIIVIIIVFIHMDKYTYPMLHFVKIDNYDNTKNN